MNHAPLRTAIRRALTIGLTLPIAFTAVAQDEDDAATLDRIEVTGSRIKRVDIEGPNPVTVIDRADLEISGDVSVADVLRSSTFNTLGSFVQSSGNTAQSQATISLRGIGSEYTLILLDGRRIASSPVLGAAAQNLNAIPFAAVERIEILRDGASALYGSDAVGGVVNIILRKDFEGLTLTGQIERPTRGEPDANSASITGGISSDRGNLTFVIDHQERDIFFNRDRATGVPGLDPAVGLSAFGFPGSAYVYSSTDGSFSGDFVGAFPDPQCPTALGSDPLFPNSVVVENAYGALCRFNYAAVSANEASLRRESAMVNGNFQLTDNVSAFTRVMANSGESFGRYAATPVTGPFPTMRGDNPNNPFGGDATLLYRFVAGGNRDSTVRDHMLDVLFGLEGQMDLFGGAEWEIAARHNRYEIDSIGTGYLLRPPLQSAIDEGTFNPFGNPNDPAFQAAVGALSHTILQNSVTRDVGIDGLLSFDLFEMANGPAGIAVGFDYRDTYFADLVDAQSAALNVSGTAGGNAQGERAQYAVFAEMALPLLSNLNLSIAARYDHYNDFGNSTNPKVSLDFRPIESLLLRASYGTGFRAPDLASLYQSGVQSFNGARDTRACNGGVPDFSAPFNPCTVRQYENRTGSNPNLEAEDSTNWGAGVVWSALDNLTFSLDYYNVELENQAAVLTLQRILDLEAEGNALVDGLVTRSPATGAIQIVNRAPLNLGGFKTAGYDFEVDYRLDTDLGVFSPKFVVTYVDKFETSSFPGFPFEDAITGSGFTPDTRAQLHLDWSLGDFAVGIVGDYIGDSSDEVEIENEDVVVNIPSWTKWNLQATWSAPWNGKVTVGVRNVADKAPPLDNFVLTSPFYLNSQYDFLGRVPYVRYEQKF
ncbi:TonB-dependent receptor plug domain-containing protein [Chiayiivirga flava]|uniref:Iron complex outermembrane receptor protein n=1 Tax=Chiayiivirga flava TaxID=659595 RepID=A0A7W8G0G0_9GAMM|nr:TonB-dependent receptor [Chiayiivirga flava]MBB5208254.1 iron complex outermembrane receptor protein [Chiayiivirga flava]